MLPGAAGLQSVAVLGEQTHWGIMKDLLSFLQHPMGLLTASWWLCPPSAPGSLVARWCGQCLGIRCHWAPFFKHPPVLQAWGRHKMEQGRHGDAVRAPSTRWQAETSPLSALVPCQGKGSPCGWGAAGLGVPRTGCPVPVPQLSGRAVPAAWGRENKRFPGLPPELGMAPNEKLVPLPLLCPSSAAPLREAADGFGGRRRLVALSGAELRSSKRAWPGIAPPGTEGPSPRRLHHAGLLGLPW